jgi:very-short-patch-repair endonuclease
MDCRYLKPRARELRNAMTWHEQALWSRIRRKQLSGAQFYRQKVLAGYIVDFYCPAAALVIELDGCQHKREDAIAYDHERTRTLNALGLAVLRFDNTQVRNDLDGVLKRIISHFQHSSQKSRKDFPLS